MATPCDGIHECLDLSDEECGEKLAQIVYFMSGGFLLIIGFVWLGLYLKIIKFGRRENDLDNLHAADRWEPRLCKVMKGNALAELKVHSFYLLLKKYCNAITHIILIPE